MRTMLSSLAIILTLPLLGCLETAAPEPTAAAESDVTVSDTTAAKPAGISEMTWWLCRPINHLFASEASCAASCSTTCVPQEICADPSGRRVPCP
jgi:hypothetical protein